MMTFGEGTIRGGCLGHVGAVPLSEMYFQSQAMMKMTCLLRNVIRICRKNSEPLFQNFTEG